MTVKAMIELLKTLPEDAEVFCYTVGDDTAVPVEDIFDPCGDGDYLVI